MAVKTMGPLISAEDLAAHLDRSEVKIFDVRGRWGGDPKEALESYQQGHIPGAVFLDWTTSFLKPDMPLALAPIGDAEDAQRAFEALGICAGDHVVLYDDYHGMLAGRLWWSLRFWGFSEVKILDGGWRAWCDQGLAVSSEAVVMPEKGTFRPQKDASLRIDLENLIATKETVTLVDARGAANFQGSAEDPRSGHIPGSINIPFQEMLDPDTGRFKSPEALEALFQEHLPDFRTRPLVASCGAGYAATVTLVALSLIGVHSVLFDESFSVWGAHPDLPVAQGA